MMKLFLVPMVLALLASPGSLWSAQAAQEPAQAAAAQEPAPEKAAPVLQTAAGELTRVDAGSKSFWIKTADGMEMQFKYTDATEVTGATDSPEGLAMLSGSRVSVQFEKVAAENIAAKIEVLPRA